MDILEHWDASMPDEKFCPIHNSHCVQIDRLEKDIYDQKNDIRDARRSLTSYMERRDTALLKILERDRGEVERHYITKHEFDPIKKLVYVTITLMIADVIRRILL